MNEAEAYAQKRIASLTRDVAACLAPVTIAAIIKDINGENEFGTYHLTSGVIDFRNKMSEQLSSWT